MSLGGIFGGLNKVGQVLQTAGQLISSKADPATMNEYRVVVEIDVKAPNKRMVAKTIKALKKKMKNAGGGLVAKMLGIGPEVEVVGMDVRVARRDPVDEQDPVDEKKDGQESSDE
jgi:hypothetical protein